ncbi:nucleotidyl transferase AbiEii/AbiGii toxin family protein [Arthrospiribacter ruber]|uniref:Nucleotidyl transferase AbiEii/AbiGii toxin family protein n=1 Tax=Arthrospiribacter ruber TaxID=2487934 RepID=A0A951ITP7_9BACT|nr:nucleotidyl transferase AbiEii/AbiGii toxin family protein [Arthrospiribacter ruber]MBW3466402.1 hypothetical protein [Arthrospiribacter ruber]
MLFKKTVNSRLLELLKELMSYSYFKEFNLVEGTSLALQIGHRESIDIDLFGKKELEETEISEVLSSLGKVQILKKSKNILVYSVDGIKVDFVNYRYPWLRAPKIYENLRLAHMSDIGAMKLNAISGRGSKKDFIDLFFLLKEFQFSDLMEFYNKKYGDGSTFLVLKSLTYFEDADLEESPRMIINTSWEEVKSTIVSEVKQYLN